MRAWVAGCIILLLAGCSEPAPPPAAVPEPFVPIVEEEPVDWAATMSPSNCVQGPVVTACGGGVSLGNSDGPAPTYLHDADGRALHGGELTMEWTPFTPTTDALRIAAFAMTDCPDDCTVERTVGTAIGRSPLLLTLEPHDGADLTIVLQVEPVAFAPNTVVSLGQELRVTGMLEFAERDPADVALDDLEDDDDDDG